MPGTDQPSSLRGLPGGQSLGAADALVRLRVAELSVHLACGGCARPAQVRRVRPRLVMAAASGTSDCSPAGSGRCRSYRPGHQLHSINGRFLGQSPWGWRDGIVTGIDGLWIHVDCVAGGSVRIWHHEDLGIEIAVGDLVRVHERYGALAISDRWLSAFIADGLGPVPDPTHPELWRSDATPVIVDLGTGRGFPVGDKDGQC